MIRTIGTAARLELERFFDTRVFLDLHVKVKGEWREDDRLLDEMMNTPSLVGPSFMPCISPERPPGQSVGTITVRGADS